MHVLHFDLGRTGNGRSLLLLFCLLIALSANSACNQDQQAEVRTDETVRELTAEEREIRERRAAALLKIARKNNPVDKIDKLVDVAHVYHDTSSGPKAWQELIFYLVDHSNDDFARAEKELQLFARRRPEALELLTAAMLYTNACIKSLMPPSTVENKKEREGQRDRALKTWVEVGERICAMPAHASHFGAHLEAGNAYAYAQRFEDAERLWAKVEEFEEPARDVDRVRVLVKRGDLFRQDQRDLKKAKALFLKVREFQDRMRDETSDHMRNYVDQVLKELEHI